MDENVKRMLDVSFSATMRISKLATEMEEGGEDIISLAVGEPDFDTPEFIIEAANEAMKKGFTHYTPPSGISELREAIAEKMKEDNDLDFTSDNVLVTPTKHALFMSVLAHLDDGAEVILPDPAWVSYGPIVKFADGILRRVPAHGEEFELKQESLEDAISSRTEMIILNSPSNPTGKMLNKEERKIIRDLAVDNDLKVVTDEVYEKLVFEGEHVSLASMDGMRERTITVNGFSKAYAMTGWRIGWLACTEDMLENIVKIQTHSITCATSFAQKAAYRALVEEWKSERALESMMDKYRERRELMLERLDEIEGFTCRKPESTFYTFPKYEFDKDSMEMSMYLLRKAKVATTPGSAFGDRGENHLRLSFANSKENIQEAMDRIEKAVEKL